MVYPRIEVSVKIKGKGVTPVIDSTLAAATVIRNIARQETILWIEEVLLLCLNAGNRLIGWYRVAIGGIDTVLHDIRVIATIALKCAASRVIISHNHPSGSLKPSWDDLRATRELRAGLRVLSIELVDHIIFTHTDHISLKDGGLL